MSTACWIYKGDKREETYLYVEREGDFEKVPAPLLSAMGSLKLVMAIELDAHRTLARADVKKVIEDLHQCGFYLQMPPHTKHPSRGQITTGVERRRESPG